MKINKSSLWCPVLHLTRSGIFLQTYKAAIFMFNSFLILLFVCLFCFFFFCIYQAKKARERVYNSTIPDGIPSWRGTLLFKWRNFLSMANQVDNLADWHCEHTYALLNLMVRFVMINNLGTNMWFQFAEIAVFVVGDLSQVPRKPVVVNQEGYSPLLL